MGRGVKSGYLLDTNHIGKAVAPGSIARQRITEVRRRGVKVGTCVPVLCEIEVGLRQVKQPDLYRLNFENLLRQVRVWPIERSTARHYGEIYHDLKRRGRVLSQIDIMLAALARQMDLVLITADLDFSAVPGIETQNWLA